MKNTGECTKAPINRDHSDSRRNAPLWRRKQHRSAVQQRAIFDAGIVTVTRYVRDACGYSEEWIDRPEDIAALKQAFLK
jgi:hypothetical protein